MAHGITDKDQMFSVREMPWHGLGVILENAPKSEDAIRIAKLDWQVVQMPVSVNGQVAEEYLANVRDDDFSILAVTSKDYKPIQNVEIFNIADVILSESDAVYETAGSLFGGKSVWCLAKFPTKKVLDDDYNDFLLISTGHDGSTPLRIASTPVRVVCNNTLQLALSQADRTWNIRHTTNSSVRITDAKISINKHTAYMNKFEEVADYLAGVKIGDNIVEQWVDQLFPVPHTWGTERTMVNVQKLRDSVLECYMKPDIKKFRGTPWGFLQATSDHSWHSQPLRVTSSFSENKMAKLLNGHSVFDKAFNIVRDKLKIPV